MKFQVKPMLKAGKEQEAMGALADKIKELEEAVAKGEIARKELETQVAKGTFFGFKVKSLGCLPRRGEESALPQSGEGEGQPAGNLIINRIFRTINVILGCRGAQQQAHCSQG